MKTQRWRPPTRILPATRQAIPVLGQGCAGLGNLYAPVSDSDAAGTLNAAWAGGVRFFDTAPYYGHGLSEQRLGRFLRSDPRRGVIVSSKVGRSLRPAVGPPTVDTGSTTSVLIRFTVHSWAASQTTVQTTIVLANHFTSSHSWPLSRAMRRNRTRIWVR